MNGTHNSMSLAGSCLLLPYQIVPSVLFFLPYIHLKKNIVLYIRGHICMFIYTLCKILLIFIYRILFYPYKWDSASAWWSWYLIIPKLQAGCWILIFRPQYSSWFGELFLSLNWGENIVKLFLKYWRRAKYQKMKIYFLVCWSSGILSN